MIIPAIDLIDGKCVRLSQGDYNRTTVYFKDPLDAAKRFEDCGLRRLHMVDLDGAKASSPMNLRTLERVACHTSLEIQYGGGLKSAQALCDAFNAGASRAICGSVAATSPEVFKRWLSEFGPAKMILGADFRDGRIAIKGWLEQSSLTLEALLEMFIPDGLSQTICTDISRDGMLCGPDIEFYRKLNERFPSVDIIVSGGVSSIADVEAAHEAGLAHVIVGKAYYDGRITLKEIERCSLGA